MIIVLTTLFFINILILISIFLMRVQIVNHINVYIVFLFIDFIVPVLLWKINGYPESSAYWLPRLNDDIATIGVVFYVIFNIIFLVIMTMFLNFNKSNFLKLVYKKKLLNYVFFSGSLFFILTILQLIIEIYSVGGFYIWIWSKFTLSGYRTSGEKGDFDIPGIFAVLRPSFIFSIFAYIGFYLRDNYGSYMRIILKYIYPFIAFLLAFQTAYRGALLLFVCSLFFVEIYRQRHSLEKNQSLSKKIIYRYLLYFSIVVLLVFLVYGNFRDQLRIIASTSNQDNIPREINLNTSSNYLDLVSTIFPGHGAVGVINIVDFYFKTESFFYGKTFKDMLLLPIPRSIYRSKPLWYGIDDITRRMGWPETTMSSVTIPGESFANFGFWGVLVAIPFGVILSLLFNMSKKSIFHFITFTPFFCIQTISTSNWMSFTGFMNSLPNLLVILLISYSCKIMNN